MLPEQVEEWGTLDWEALIDDIQLALARLVCKKTITMELAWKIFAYVTHYEKGPTTQQSGHSFSFR